MKHIFLCRNMYFTATTFKILKFTKRKRSLCRLICSNPSLPNFKKVGRRENRNASSWRVMFFGSDDFSLGTLTRLNDEMRTTKTVSKLEVVTSKWHLNPVRLFGQQNSLVTHEWPIDVHLTKGFDIGVVASFGHMIPKEVIDSFPLGMLNVHGSLLPRWRGAAPVNYAIMHGDKITGISIMRIQPHAFDVGEVISKKEVQIHSKEMAPQLRKRLSEIGGEEIISCIRKLPTCLENAEPQLDYGVTYAPKLTSDVGHINFEKMNAKCIYNRYRGLFGMVPLMTSWNGLRLTLHDVSECDNSNTENQLLIGINTVKNSSQPAPSTPGQVFYDKKSKALVIRCIENSFLIVRRVAPHRRKPMSALEFYNGYMSKQDKAKWMFI
ncbi:Methionyl-tRNA formyltransferase, mitochondrial [Frankliniella fusca]|uniref:Methionyl-tRNA formyltransferase, mitochondrial n=1 Tax=Frankliniella fusca TaxID=407009 RepID=A0AAE1HW90_9NEOP|nr:Methionyl-tRNA formyltransferase, mitochondrial [Frankliniella fusca]